MDFILKLLRANRIVTIDNFLSVEECKWYSEKSKDLTFVQTLVSDTASDYTGEGKSGHGVTTNDRVTSQSAYGNTYPEEYTLVTNDLRARLAELVNVPVSFVESIQTSKYFKNNRFDYHEDCGLGEGNERQYTALIYINKPIAGGQTDFLNMKKTVEPEPGRLVLWDNLDNDLKCNHDLIHAGLPVIEGEKHILVTWISITIS